ncbi:uncharacterized protein LOC117289186 isoform X2 [Asterias rubens]|uniref:uncharacterized protein LOC117289186 isoform X2 n=1 Tax=Asterias rubens TaxID=7604 RepID=UPI0014559899|nr:uncharacterized protein LOC117289186 isoform X2 [Asterias rubens]
MSAESEIQANVSATNSYKFPTKSSCAGSVGGRNITLDRDFAAAQRRGVKGPKHDDKLESVLNSITPGQGTMLHLASKLGNADVVRALLISGADPSVLDENKNTAYEKSCSDQVSRVYHDVLLQAVAQSNLVLATNLLKAGIDINDVDDEETGNTPLHWAASYGNLDTVKLLCEKGADINSANVDGATALHDAVSRGDVAIVSELVRKGAKTTVKAKKGKYATKTPMSLAESKPKLKTALEGESLPNGDVKKKSNGTKEAGVTPLTPLTPTSPDDLQQQLANLLKQSEPAQLVPVTDEKFQLLWPRPKSMIKKEGEPLKLKPHFLIRVIAGTTGPEDCLQQMVDIWSIHGPLLGELGFKCVLECAARNEYPDPYIICQFVPHLFQGKDGYRINVSDKKMMIQCAGFTGLWNASCTFMQLIRLFGDDGIPAVQISDSPDMQYRGVSLDISCGRVPKLDFLMHVVNVLTLLKFNELHLYMKASDGEEVEGVMPFSESELLDLEIYCKWRHMAVIPSLDIDSESELTPKQMAVFKQIMTSFGSTKWVSLGSKLVKKLLASSTETSPYLAELDIPDRLHLMGIKDYHQVRFCANLLDCSTGPVTQLPTGSMAMHYGTKVDYDFNAACKELTESGMAFTVCPGTAAWNTISGCPEAMIRNVYNAVTAAGQSSNAIGLMVTDWSGSMFINQPTVSFPGFAVAGGLAWNKNVEMDFVTDRLAELLNYHFFLESTSVLGHAVMELGRVETLLTRSAWNMAEGQLSKIPNPVGTFLCQFIKEPDAVDLEHVTPEVLQKTMKGIRKVQLSLSTAKKTPVQEFSLVELQMTSDIMLWATRVTHVLVQAGKKPAAATAGSGIINVGMANANATAKTDCANKLLSIMDMYRKVWLHTNHTSGLLGCLGVFKTILEKLIPSNIEEFVDDDNEEDQ